MRLSTEIADQIVDFIFAESGLKAIICDTTGVIIAAVDKDRIGLLHSGACRILQQGLDELQITAAEEAASGGLVRVGVNMPIRYGTEVLGTYGVGGDVALVRPVAKICVGLIRNALQEAEASRKIAEQEQRLQTLFGNMAEGVALHELILNAAGEPVNYKIIQVNDSYERLLGVTRAEVVGKLATEAYGTPEPPYLQKFAAVGLSGVPDFLETYFAPLDKHFLISIAPWGQAGFATIFADVSERRRLEEKLAQEKMFTDAVLDSVPGLLYLYDDQGNLLRWNKQHEILTGYSAAELAQMKLLDWYAGDAAATEHIAREAGRAFAEGYADAEENLRCKDGSRVPMYFTAVRLDSGGRSYIVGIAIDITERKKSQQALQEILEKLEEKVESRTQELTAANEELRALNEEMVAMNEELVQTNDRLQTMQSHLVQSEKMAALGSLVAGIAHEINTPVGVGVTAASHLNNLSEQFEQTLSQGVPAPEVWAEYVEDTRDASAIILKNLERASRLIKSFKQVSVDQSSESKRVFAVREYLDEILLSLQPQLRKTNLSVTVECDPTLKLAGYPGALAQIVTNLLMNSLMHAYDPDATGLIRIVAARKGDSLELHYADDGRGMAPEVAAKIFEPFFTTRRGSGGTGLGLFVVYNIVVRQMEGTIACTSEPGRGTTFTISFPCKEALP